MSFDPAKAKLTIGSLDDTGLTVSAQYNPKELQVDQTVPWKKPQAANQAGGAKGKDEEYLTLEFVGAEGREMSVELLFDGYEDKASIASKVGILEEMARVRDPSSSKETMRRPHHCIVSWGERGLPKFKCVIESLSTKYTMFSTEGTPLRATCTVKLKEAEHTEKQSKKK